MIPRSCISMVRPGLDLHRKAIVSVDEVKGMRIKVHAEDADIITALGGTPVTMPITETYDAVQKGLLDGILLPFEALKRWKFGEVVKTTLVNHAFLMRLRSCGDDKDKWNTISKADEQVVEKMTRSRIESGGGFGIKWTRKPRSLSFGRRSEVLPASKADEAKVAEKMEDHSPEFVKDMKAKGLNGDEVLGIRPGLH